MKKLIIPVALLLVVSFSCKKENNIEDEVKKEVLNNNVTITQGVTGTVLSANGNVKLIGVKVYVDINGEVFFTKTNKNGFFQLQLPTGNHDLMMITGDGSKFRSVVPVSVSNNEVVALNSNSSVLRQVGDLAYVEGDYDDIETIVYDSLGYNITQIQPADFSDLSYLKTFDAIFMNCGSQFNYLNTSEYNNVKDYVVSGGSLYASDWAVGYLTGRTVSTDWLPTHQNTPHHSHDVALGDRDNVSRSCPTRYDGIIDNSNLCTDRTGNSGFVNNAFINDPNLQFVLSTSMINVEYDLGAWEVIQNVGGLFDVLISDGSGYGPLAIRSNANLYPYLGGTSSGSTSGNSNGNGNGNWVTICHIPPGNPSNPQTITISTNALAAHLAHGCSVGSCEGEGGSVLYTTFHNHPGGHTSPEIKLILQDFILNI